MMKKPTVLLAAMIGVFFSSSFAQEKPVWIVDIEESVNKGEWRTIHSRLYKFEDSNKFHSITLQLLYKEKANVTVDISLKSSTNVANDEFKRALKLSQTYASDFRLVTLKNINENDGYLTRTGELVYVRFRKGRVLTEIYSQSEDIAKTLAQLIADKVPRKD